MKIFFSVFLWGLGTLVWLMFHTCLQITLIVFCGANPNSLCYLCALFLCFEAISGLKINLPKLELVLMGNVVKVDSLVGILGCGVSSLPLKYIGLPLGASYKASIICLNGGVEKTERWLANWKMMYLFKGGRVTLIKSTLFN
jgi:hypothetical protein